MKILKYLFIIIVPNILLAQKTCTLQECVERALEMNISIKQSELDYVGSEIEKKGAIGNFLDRMSNGSVLDIIILNYNQIYFPAIFNIADILISFGSFLSVTSTKTTFVSLLPI